MKNTTPFSILNPNKVNTPESDHKIIVNSMVVSTELITPRTICTVLVINSLASCSIR